MLKTTSVTAMPIHATLLKNMTELRLCLPPCLWDWVKCTGTMAQTALELSEVGDGHMSSRRIGQEPALHWQFHSDDLGCSEAQKSIPLQG